MSPRTGARRRRTAAARPCGSHDRVDAARISMTRGQHHAWSPPGLTHAVPVTRSAKPSISFCHPNTMVPCWSRRSRYKRVKIPSTVVAGSGGFAVTGGGRYAPIPRSCAQRESGRSVLADRVSIYRHENTFSSNHRSEQALSTAEGCTFVALPHRRCVAANALTNRPSCLTLAHVRGGTRSIMKIWVRKKGHP